MLLLCKLRVISSSKVVKPQIKGSLAPIPLERSKSLERFFGILIEQYAGAFPLWLAPEQARILPITEHQLDYAKAKCEELRRAGLRVEVDCRAASLGAKIKDARNGRIPYILVAGAQEAESNILAVRSRREGELGTMTIEDLAKKMQTEVENKIS